jgi:hypothetical protein
MLKIRRKKSQQKMKKKTSGKKRQFESEFRGEMAGLKGNVFHTTC